ncbi:MAG: hypothetical protein WBB97_07765 [Dehalococcoidales bacterium]
MEWQELENIVRRVASFLWECEAKPEIINGVNIDCVCKIKTDYWITVEITQEKSLEKLRTDLAKFASIRPYLFSKNIYAECYFVTENKPNISLIETGKGQNVDVLSLDSFQKILFDHDNYYYIRASKPFGSAIQPVSGEKDTIKYVPVEYRDVLHSRKYRINDLARLLFQSNRIILSGNYGTGKSRCIQELFTYISKVKHPRPTLPISIDLRSHWGTKKGTEIIRRHFDDLGLSRNADNAIKIMPKGGFSLLLDGFDEIASQTWSDDPTRLMEIRARSLVGVKDLIQNCKGGLIITGREHYFNSNTEMFHSLGLSPETTILVRCEDEFTDLEMSIYLKNISIDIPLPKWLPRRPIICKIASDIEPATLKELLSDESGEVGFWEHFIKAICEREARINPTLDSASIKNILCNVASITRTKLGDLGPISITELNQAFETVVGTRPTDETAIILQRLPALGRVASDTPDRQFVDHYILDGLRAEDVISCVNERSEEVLNEPWINPLKRLGITLVADNINFTKDHASYMTYMRKVASCRNQILASDILTSLCFVLDEIDFHNLLIQNSHISSLDLSGKKISNLSLVDTVIEDLDITGVDTKNVLISKCLIKDIYGVSGAHGLPDWMSDNEIEHYQSISTVSRIRAATLTKQQEIFLTIIHKTFFQPGSGRKEEALLRGLGTQIDSKIANKITSMLLREGVLKRIKGEEGYVYVPNRGAFIGRMNSIREQLTSSDDPIWKQLNKI